MSSNKNIPSSHSINFTPRVFVSRSLSVSNKEDEKENERLDASDEDRDDTDAASISPVVKVEVSLAEDGHASPPRGGTAARPPPPPPPMLTPMPQIATRGLEAGTAGPAGTGSGTRGMEEFLGKSGMFHFGDVLVDHHPDAPPVPMVVPMVYLVPLSNLQPENNGTYETRHIGKPSSHTRILNKVARIAVTYETSTEFKNAERILKLTRASIWTG